MKKTVLFCISLGCIVMFGCGQKLGENESEYDGELIISGVGPEIAMEPTIEEGTLALRGSFEDHADHIFLGKGIWENYLREESDYLPGNALKFKGIVESIDGAAGNHYYNVKTIDKLEVIKYPNVNNIKDLLEGYNYCEKDSDCGYLDGECPLGCYIPLNIKYIDVASNIVSNFVNHLGEDERCVYGCTDMDEAVCKNYKCEMIVADVENHDEPIICTSEQKSADICTMIYEPVCGSDSRTYGNSCVACQSETVESYTIGECEDSAFAVEGNSKYLDEVMDILKWDGTVSCNYSYNDAGTVIYGSFMADRDNFYSSIDDYSSNTANKNYMLSTGGKLYYWSTFPDSDNFVVDFPVDIESEIADILVDAGKYSDFQIDCSEGIENEDLFEVPNLEF